MKPENNIKTLKEVLEGSALSKVCAILRENDYTYTHDDGGYRTFSPDEIELIKDSLMKESSQERDYAQDYINFYNALMQYSNFMSNSAANCDKEMVKLMSLIDVLEMEDELGKFIQEYVKQDYVAIKRAVSIPFAYHGQSTGGFIEVKEDGTYEVDIEKKGTLLSTMHRQSDNVQHAYSVLKAWIEVGKELIGKDYKSQIMDLVPFNFMEYLTTKVYTGYPNKYYINSQHPKDDHTEDEKFAVIPNYDQIPVDTDGRNAAESILNVTLQQWQLSKEKIAAMKKRLKKA